MTYFIFSRPCKRLNYIHSILAFILKFKLEYYRTENHIFKRATLDMRTNNKFVRIYSIIGSIIPNGKVYTWYVIFMTNLENSQTGRNNGESIVGWR